jgi:hypothetical protein
MSQASEVYARLLIPKRLGFPLWCPAPDDNLPNKYRQKGVGIGDVGILTADGGFDFLFNICVPPDDPINHHGVPIGFENVSEDKPPIQISKQEGFHQPGNAITSTSVTHKNIDANFSLQDMA